FPRHVRGGHTERQQDPEDRRPPALPTADDLDACERSQQAVRGDEHRRDQGGYVVLPNQAHPRVERERHEVAGESLRLHDEPAIDLTEGEHEKVSVTSIFLFVLWCADGTEPAVRLLCREMRLQEEVSWCACGSLPSRWPPP